MRLGGRGRGQTLLDGYFILKEQMVQGPESVPSNVRGFSRFRPPPQGFGEERKGALCLATYAMHSYTFFLGGRALSNIWLRV